MRIMWLTDIHLDMLRDDEVEKYFNHITAYDHDAILITGDISDNRHILHHLQMIDRLITVPCYFVCGNHDFYGGSIKQFQKSVDEFCKNLRNVKYLSSMSHTQIGSYCLVGQDAWYDGVASDPTRSNVIMNDWLKIEEFYQNNCVAIVNGIFERNLPNILKIAKYLAQIECSKLENKINTLIKAGHDKFIIATHVPPFNNTLDTSPRSNNACWYTSKIIGDMIEKKAQMHPEINFHCFSGHVHRTWRDKINHNLIVHTGKSEYSRPGVAGFIET